MTSDAALGAASEQEDEAPVEVASVEELVLVTNLFAVQTLELSAVLSESFGEERPEVPDISMAFRDGHAGRRFETVFTVTVATREADLSMTASGRYETDFVVAWTQELMTGFAERVGFMHVYPYLRQGVAALAAQLGVPIPQLPMMRAGQFKLNASPRQDAPSTTG